MPSVGAQRCAAEVGKQNLPAASRRLAWGVCGHEVAGFANQFRLRERASIFSRSLSFYFRKTPSLFPLPRPFWRRRQEVPVASPAAARLFALPFSIDCSVHGAASGFLMRCAGLGSQL
jgi:hypothetical protein